MKKEYKHLSNSFYNDYTFKYNILDKSDKYIIKINFRLYLLTF